MPKVLIVGGPTASGKKQFTISTAECFEGEIVSADSRKVYRLLDIGTAKPSREERERIPHHLIDIIEPDEPFSAGEWIKRASEAVRDILERGKLPIISGGTGFYIEAFQEGLSEGISSDPKLRAALERELAECGPEAMYEKLSHEDPERAEELHVNDTYRVLRSLEIYYSTGQTSMKLRNSAKITGGEYDYFFVGIDLERPMLYRQINERVDKMVAGGLLDELSSVLARGYSRSLPSLDTVGYKEWFPFLDGADSFENCLEQVKRDTRRYAKRQLTWFRNKTGIRWIYPSESGAVEDAKREISLWIKGADEKT